MKLIVLAQSECGQIHLNLLVFRLTSTIRYDRQVHPLLK